MELQQDGKLEMSVRYTIKQSRPGYRGATIKYGTKSNQPLSAMVMGVVFDIVEHYAQFQDIATINDQLDIVRDWLSGWHVEPATPPEESEAQDDD